jgi:tetratricopeptide (TPR) repeat protein
MIRILLCCILCLVILSRAAAQDACELSLTRAQEEFDAGRFVSVPGILNECLQHNQNREWEQRANLLLAETYLLLQDNEKAEECYLKVLKANPEYVTDEKRDPIDLVYLSKKFTSDPIFSIGGMVGMNASFVRPINDAVIAPQYDREESYSSRLGGQVSVYGDYHYSPKISATLEVNYSFCSFSHRTEGMFHAGNYSLEFTEKQSWIGVPLLVKYSDHKGSLRPYCYGGLGFNFLIADKASLVLNGNNESPEINYKGVRNSFARTLIVGAGAKYKWKLKYLFGEVRYSAGLSNMTNSAGRYPDINTTWPYADDDFRLDNLTISIGYVHPLYNPRKLKKARTKSVLRKIGKEEYEN